MGGGEGGQTDGARFPIISVTPTGHINSDSGFVCSVRSVRLTRPILPVLVVRFVGLISSNAFRVAVTNEMAVVVRFSSANTKANIKDRKSEI